MILTPDNEYTVVLDACVLVPMPLCDTLLRLAEEPAMYRPIWSEEILQEVGAALGNSLKRTPAQITRRLTAMREAFPEAMVSIPAALPDAFECIPDPKDRHVLAAAVRGHANAIVTYNERHFPQECLEQHGVLRQSPDDFLVHQYHVNPDVVRQKLDDQASALRRERPALLAVLRPLAPHFADLIGE